MGLSLGAISGSAYVLSESGQTNSSLANSSDVYANNFAQSKRLEARIPLFAWAMDF